MSVLFCRRFNLIWSALHSIRELLLTILTRLAVDAAEIDRCGLVITEYLSNSIRHGDGEHKSVNLVISRTRHAIKIELIESAAYFHPLLSSSIRTDIHDGNLRSGGMGLALISHYYPNFEYTQKDNRNHFSFDIPMFPEKIRVVVLDDEIASLKLLESYLVEYTCCRSFSDETLAYEYLTSHHVDLLLIDMNLNQMMATEFLSKMKTFEHFSDVGIVIISSDDSLETIRQANFVGVDDYLIKPVTKNDLKLVCERVIHRRLPNHIDRKHNIQLPESFDSGQFNVSVFGSAITQTGGDFVYRHRLAPDNTIIIFGDVMGHGERANRVAENMIAFLAGFCHTPYDSLTQFANQLVRLIDQQGFMKQSITTLMIIELKDNEVRWVNIGHPNAIIWDPKFGVKVVGTQQPLFGLSTSEVYDDDHYHLKQGEVFLVVTDGVFENHNNFERLETFVSNRFKRIKTGEKFDVSQLWEACHSDLSTSVDDMSLLVVSLT